MKFQIKHECRGRIRVQAVQQRMTLEQADMLEAWLLTLPQVERASVHERTRCAVIEYQGDRQDLLRALAGFSYQNHALAELVPLHSSRALNRAYEEKLVGRAFARCNSGYLVNLAQVSGVQQDMVQVGPYALQISRPRRKAFLAALADYIGGEGV